MTEPVVVVVGAVNVDLVVMAPRLPGPGQTVVGAGPQRFGGGKGANAAVAAARAGARVHYVGAVGDDEFGRVALAELAAEGIDVSGVEVSAKAPTGVALIVVDAEGENQIAVGAGANERLSAAAVGSALGPLLPGVAGCVLVSTEIPGEAVAAAVEIAGAAGIPCVLNPAPVIPAVLELLRCRPVLTPNAGELADLTSVLAVPEHARAPAAQGAGPHPDVAGRARVVAAATGAGVVVTLGAQGVLLVGPDGAVEHLPPHPTTVVDTTGAGDTFNGVLAARLAAGVSLEAAARTANIAAARSVAVVGARTGMPHRLED